ncbi:MAG: patatin-like phospholipase family protein [Balneolaceae bacterium]|nr:patatin-like phospholipase family protein [Balneolaceae bacterium]
MEGKTALVLSGGGAKGSFQVGALQVLREKGYEFEAISGVSVGSLNGSMLATGQFDAMVDVWEGIDASQVLRKNSLLKVARQFLFYKMGISDPPVSMNDNAPLRNLMKNHLMGKKAKVPFHFGYVKLESGEYVNAVIRRTGDHRVDEADIDRVLSSTAIPVMFNPTMIGGMMCVDGGVRNISPISEVLPYEPDRVIIIPTEPVKGPKENQESPDIINIAFRTINILLDEIFQEDISRFLSLNELVRQAESQDAVLKKSNGSRYKYIEPVIIDPKEPLGSALNFENDRMHELMEIGRQRALEVLE